MSHFTNNQSQAHTPLVSTNRLLKLDLKRSGLNQHSKLKEALKLSSAYRICVLVTIEQKSINSALLRMWSLTPDLLFAPLQGAPESQTDFLLMKAPTLEGTELWIVRKQDQAIVKALTGMVKLEIVAGLHALEMRDLPFEKEELGQVSNTLSDDGVRSLLKERSQVIGI